MEMIMQAEREENLRAIKRSQQEAQRAQEASSFSEERAQEASSFSEVDVKVKLSNTTKHLATARAAIAKLQEEKKELIAQKLQEEEDKELIAQSASQQATIVTLSEDNESLQADLVSVEEAHEQAQKEWDVDQAALEEQIRQNGQNLESHLGKIRKELEEALGALRDSKAEMSKFQEQGKTMTRLLDEAAAKHGREAAELQKTIDTQTKKEVKLEREVAALKDKATKAEGERDATKLLLTAAEEQIPALNEHVEELELDMVEERAVGSQARLDARVWMLDSLALRGLKGQKAFFEVQIPESEDPAEAEAEFEELNMGAIVSAVGKNSDLGLLLRIIHGDFQGQYSQSQERATGKAGAGSQTPSRAGSATSTTSRVSIREKAKLERKSSQASMGGADSGGADGRSLMKLERGASSKSMIGGGMGQRLSEAQLAEAALAGGKEWREKCVALAQRLEQTESELRLPRPNDVVRIKELEGQARALIAALHRATGSKSPDTPTTSSNANSLRKGAKSAAGVRAQTPDGRAGSARPDSRGASSPMNAWGTGK
ncbi:hypothetical protein T484DRAFT_1911835 [Baffinella frigidus]|nr:hypothetical protein T484DRAFT_1911835 [Cryptophyta sp. CCMP2293]